MEKTKLEQTISYFKYRIFKINQYISKKKHTELGLERLYRKIELYEYAISVLELSKNKGE